MFTYVAVIIGGAMLTAWIGLVSMMMPVIGSAHDEVILNRVSYRAEAETFVVIKQIMHNPTMYPTNTKLILCDTDREKVELLYNISRDYGMQETQHHIEVIYTDGPTHATVTGAVNFKWVEDVSGTQKMKIINMTLY